MSVPPQVSDEELAGALRRIEERHRAVDDSRWSDAGTEPRDVLMYLLGPGSAHLSPGVRAGDARDALVLWVWLWWQDRRLEHRLLSTGRRVGITLSDLGAPLGIKTGQGLQDRINRLDALLAHGRPDGATSRSARAEARGADGQQAWVRSHYHEVAAGLAALIAEAQRVLPGRQSVDTFAGANTPDNPRPADAEEEIAWLDDIRADYLAGHITPATLAMAALAAGELSAHPAVRTLDPRHQIHAALRAITLIRSRLQRASL